MGSIGRQFCGQYGQQLHWTDRVLLFDHIGNFAAGPLDGLSILFTTLLGNIVTFANHFVSLTHHSVTVVD